MKKQILLFFLILSLGGLAIFLPSFLSSYNERREEREIIENKKIKENFINEISSNEDLISKKELTNEERESDPYDPKQMYFENIEILFTYFSFSEVENIKQKLQNYIHQTISEEILDCKLNDTIEIKNDKIILQFIIEDNKLINVEVNKNKFNETINITIIREI